MVRAAHQRREDELARLARVKASPAGLPDALGPELISFFKTSVQKRQTKLEKLADCWSQLVPELLNEHCALEGFSRGTLTVLVDTASHLYELKQLLLAGLEKQLLAACKGAGLKKVALRRGRWYDGEGDASDRRVRFA
jgi:hypothetical protein